MPSPVPFDPARLRDPALRSVAEKVRAGERLTRADGIALYRSTDVLGLGAMADAVNRARHGDVVTFAANQHINPTNVCVLRATCAFCGYARLPKEQGAYRYTLDQVLAEAAHAADGLTREFHIVGGLDMQAGLEYYATMFRALKANFPHVHIKALTAVEIAHLARIEKLTWAEVLTTLREAGLVVVRPDAQRRWYQLRPEPLRELDAWLAPYREAWSERLDALSRHLDRMEEEER